MFRTLLIWLLAVALPAQGVMAATMVFCGPDHDDRAVALTSAHGAGPAHQPHASIADSDDAAAQAQPTASIETAAPDDLAQAGAQKCSVCAVCCSTAAIHDTALALPRVEPVAADFARLAPEVEPFATGGPDRPPRHILA